MLRINFASQDKQLHSNEEIFYLQNGMTSEIFVVKCFPRRAFADRTTSERGRDIDIQKPQVSDVYTANMGGVDGANQFRSYCTIGRQSQKWYGTSFSSFLTLLPTLVIF